MMEKLSFKLPEFEGPLDLLLHLISKHKIEITDIPIAALLEQYLAYIDEMQLQDMEVSSEFLEMAARLVYIKSAMLLPRQEEAAQLKQELTGELLEYQACKAMAGRLKDFYAGDTIFAGKGAQLPKDMTYRRVHDSEVLAKAYLRCVGRAGRRLPPPRESFTQIVSKRFVSVTSRIMYVLRRLYRRGSVSFRSLFLDGGRDRSQMVATFLAVLELVKNKRVSIDDADQDTLYFRGRGEQEKK